MDAVNSRDEAMIIFPEHLPLITGLLELPLEIFLEDIACSSREIAQSVCNAIAVSSAKGIGLGLAFGLTQADSIGKCSDSFETK
jgi:hypothetical protein